MREVLDRLHANGKHLLGLINDVLDLSKIEAGELTLDLADYSLKEVVQTVFTAVESLATGKKLALTIDVAPNLPRGHGDERRLVQVLLNLVGNAIKFTDKGEVAIKATMSDGSFTVAVRDTGPGIAPSDQDKIFGEFQQADNAATKRKGGTGLGLSIAKRIIGMHGGRIWVESDVGKGSTFAFTIPVKVERQVSRAMSKCILVVEDQEDNRRILRDLFANAGYELIEAESGEEALTALTTAAPGPDLDGHSTAGDGRLRSNAAYPPQSGVKIDPDHCSDLLCAGRRRGQGSGCGLHCLRHQAVQSARVACESARALSPCRVSEAASRNRSKSDQRLMFALPPTAASKRTSREV